MKFNFFTILGILLLTFNLNAWANADSDADNDADNNSGPEPSVRSTAKPGEVTALPQHDVNSSPPLYLRVGQKYPLEGLVSEETNVSPPEIATVTRTAEGIMIQAKQVGKGQLAVKTQDQWIKIQLVVQGANPQKTPLKSNAIAPNPLAIEKVPGIAVAKLGNKTVIQGEVLSRSGYQMLLLHLKEFTGKYVVLARTTPAIKQSLIEQAHALFKQHHLNNVSISYAGNRFFLEGSIQTPLEVEKAFTLAQSILPNIENHLAIPLVLNSTVSIKVFLLELSRKAHQTLGFSWPAQVRQMLTFGPQQFSFNPLWMINLKHLSETGEAKILAEPMLAVKSGASAELSAGGEIPIRVIGRQENKVFWKHYGLKVKIHIGGINQDHIRTKIFTESSQLDESVQIDGLPGIKRTHMNTEVDAEAGKPIILTGLFQATAAKDVEKMPLLGSIPILGELFKSRQFKNAESELLVALLPSLGAETAKLPLESLHGLNFDQKWRPLD